MKPKEALQKVIEKFPFQGYIDPAKRGYLNIAETVLRYLPAGARVLDFGCGPCDKTALLQMLGFKCSAYDDLQDDWHKIKGNRDKIVDFARETGIDFRLAGNGPFPFAKMSFDMLILTDILEHLHDSPCQLMNDLLELVKPEGYLLVIVPNAVNIRKRINVMFGRTNLPPFEYYYWYPGPWRGHVREYTKGDLIKLAKYLDLDIVELRSAHNTLTKLPGFLRPIYLALTVVFTGWRESWLLVAKKRAGWTPKKSLPRDRFEKLFGATISYKY